MRARSVFVTGGTGYLGSRLIPRLLERGHRVRALVRPASLHRLPPGCDAVAGDALDPRTFAHRIAPCDTLVHLVGTPHPHPSKARLFREVDLASTRQAITAAQVAGVRHLVYVGVAHPAPVMRAYVEARREAEAAIRASGLAATVLRPWYVLGPGHRWPFLLLPLYALLERIPATRDTARRLGLVTLPQMLRALIAAVESPPDALRVVEVPEIRAARLHAPGRSPRPSSPTPGPEVPMPEEQSLAVARALYEEVINADRLDRADLYLAEGVVDHEPVPGMEVGGVEGFRHVFSMLRAAFPDLHLQVHDLIAQGDRVVARLTMRGTHRGPFLQHAPTGRTFEIPTIDILRVRDGKVVEHWGVTDTLSMLEQLGILPAPAAPVTHIDITGVRISGNEAANKRVVRSFIERLNRRDREGVAALLAPDFAFHGGGFGEVRGPEGFLAMMPLFLDAFPDLEITLEELIAEGDRVVGRFTARATHRGEFLGVPPTGRPVTLVGNNIYRVEGGKIAEEWWVDDIHGLLQQLTATPAIPAADAGNAS